MIYLSIYGVIAVLTFFWSLRIQKSNDALTSYINGDIFGAMKGQQTFLDKNRNVRILTALIFGVLAPFSTMVLIYKKF